MSSSRHLCLLMALTITMVIHGQVLYEVSGNSTAAKSYILATNRYVDMQFVDTIPNAYKCFSRCDKVITEFAMQDYQAIAALRSAAVLPDSVKLRAYYTDTQYSDINDALLINLGMGLDQLCRMKPAYLTEMFRAELMKRWLDYDDERTFDRFFLSVAADKDLPVYGLDDVGETMYMQFDREPVHWQCQELLKVITYPEREVRLERELRSMYLMGRLNDMVYLVTGPDNESTLSYSDYQIYARRNAVWVKRLRLFLADGNAFITLDALYLGGDDGLLALLRRDGYRVRAVNR